MLHSPPESRAVSRLLLWMLIASGTATAHSALPAAQDPAAVVTTIAGTAPLSGLLSAQALVVGPSGDVFIYENRDDASGRITRYRPSTDELTHYAGGGSGPEVDGGINVGTVRQGRGIAAAPDGTLYFSQGVYFNIRKVSTSGVITGYAGGYLQRGSNDGPAADARFSWLGAMAADSSGVLYVLDPENFTVRRIGTDGMVTTLAGSAGQRGDDDGVGPAARFRTLSGIAVDPAGNVYVGDGQRLRRITPLGEVSTLAGTLGVAGVDDGQGPAARFGQVMSLTYGGGVLTALDRRAVSGCGVRRITTAGEVSTPTSAVFGCDHLAAAPDGRVYIVTNSSGHVGGNPASLHVLLPSGSVTHLFDGFSSFVEPTSVATRNSGLIHGTGEGHYYYFRPGSPLTAPGTLAQERSVTVPADGVPLLALACAVQGGSFSAGQPTGDSCGADDGTGAAARFREPSALTLGNDGMLYVADTGNHTIRRVTSGAVVTTFAGTGGLLGQADGPVGTATFNRPSGIVRTDEGVIYVADTDNHTIRRITGGVVSTLAGLAGVPGAVNDTGAAARFHRPMGLALDLDGSVIVADSGNHLIRRVTPAGVVTTIAGQANVAGRLDGSAGEAQFKSPQAVAVDGSGTIYVADTKNRRIRRIRQSAAVAPVITAQPVSATVNRRQTASLSCRASGRPSPDYQWQRRVGNGNWLNVTGAVEFDYTTPAAVLGQPVHQYRCLASNEAGWVTSDEVTLTVTSYDLAASPSTLRFGATRANAGAAWQVTAPQQVSISYVSPVVPEWTVTSNASWLSASPTSGRGAGTFTVTVVPPNDFTGTLIGNLTLSAPNAGLTTLIRVELRVVTSDAPPIGAFDTPVSGAQNLTGAIVVSGWALDDAGIDKVEIWRDLAPGESTPPYAGPGPGNGKVFVAHGDFIPGTRPDVETIYAAYPAAHRSGWGYVLLTYGFPDRGNGTYTLHAFAYDTTGQWTTLGSKTIGVNNNAATKPFGTIDYPAPGVAISGLFRNNGWVLTPNVGGVPSCAITSVTMTIDSGPASFPVAYGTSRPDVGAAFPGHSGGANVGGEVTFDTTQFTNGLHTIGWLASDDCGRSEGIGSRFLYIQNAGGADARRKPTRDLASLGLTLEPAAQRNVRVEAMERAEVELPVIAGASWTGHELVGGEARQLPIGSTLDEQSGRFYWAPGPGFLGSFDLRFVAHVNGVAVAHVPVRITVGPSIQLSVDSPVPMQDTSMHFVIEGWAADLAAATGTGIDAVHVWAYPVAGGDPLFVGLAELGVSRPDVAALHGLRFGASGFRLPVTHLPRGLHDLVIYPHSAVDNQFRGARVVRIHIR